MEKLHIKLKIVISFLKSLKTQNNTLTNISIMPQDTTGPFFKKTESIGKPTDLWKVLKKLGLPNKFILVKILLWK